MTELQSNAFLDLEAARRRELTPEESKQVQEIIDFAKTTFDLDDDIAAARLHEALPAPRACQAPAVMMMRKLLRGHTYTLGFSGDTSRITDDLTFRTCIIVAFEFGAKVEGAHVEGTKDIAFIFYPPSQFN